MSQELLYATTTSETKLSSAVNNLLFFTQMKYKGHANIQITPFTNNAHYSLAASAYCSARTGKAPEV